MWCRDSVLKIIGLFGVLLVMVGMVQIGEGIYFMVVLPIFGLASNIWTGFATGLAGMLFMYYGYSHREAGRRSYAIIFFCLAALMTNIFNLVIIQVGEKSRFVSEDFFQTLNDDSETKEFFDIAIWTTTALSAAAIALTFVTAQYLFCGSLGGGAHRLKGQIAFLEDLHQGKQEAAAGGSRFFPPSRLAPSKVDPPPSAHENELWIAPTPRISSSSTWREESLRRGGGGGESGGAGGGGGGGRHAEVVAVAGGLDVEDYEGAFALNCSGQVANFFIDSYEGRKEAGLKGESNKIECSNDPHAMKDVATKLSFYNVSTFKPKYFSKMSSSKNTAEKKNKAEQLSTNDDSQWKADDLPPFLQNHPNPWMFLLPVISQVVGVSPWNKLDEEHNAGETVLNQETPVVDNKDLSKSKVLEPTMTQDKDSGLVSVLHTSTENLITTSPRARSISKLKSRLKRPNETPPPPPTLSNNSQNISEN